jgi:hypothetical protein
MTASLSYQVFVSDSVPHATSERLPNGDPIVCEFFNQMVALYPDRLNPGVLGLGQSPRVIQTRIKETMR